MRWTVFALILTATFAVPGRAEPPETSTLQIAFGPGVLDAELTLQEADGKIAHASKKGSALSLPPGEYQLTALMIRMKSGSKGDWRLYGHTHEAQRTIRVEAGKTSTLTLGGPFDLRVEAVLWGPDGDRLDVVDAHFVGADDLRYRFEVYTDAGDPRMRKLLRIGEKTLDLDDLEYG